MDQVRTIAFAVWKQRFWLLSGIGIIVAVVCWNMATTDLEDRFSKRKSAIEGKFGQVSSITNEAFHPNDDVNKGNLLQVEEQKKIVGKLWANLYEQQRTEVLFWPKLGDGFAEVMATKKFGDDINRNLRGLYQNYIKNQFAALREIVKASEITKGGRGGGYSNSYGQTPAASGPGATEEVVVKKYLVDWLDQASLKSRLEFASIPSAVKIWVTQEDIWVYKTLLNVIANTNQLRGATRQDNTAISTIVQLQVGKDAAASNLRGQSIYIPSQGQQVGGAPGGGYDSQATTGAGGGQEYGGEQGYGAPGSEELPSTILADRYLDEAGETYPGDSADFGTEYRKLPIRMVLKMDQRMIPVVLVECANATLPIEVTRLSVNSAKSNTTGFSGNARRASRRPSTRSSSSTDLRELSEVEIQGVVLIYEQPDESVLPTAEIPTT